jgi:hypothetical protein
MLFDQDFIENIDHNPVGSIVRACDICIDNIERRPPGWDYQDLMELMDASALVREVIASHQLNSENVLPDISNSLDTNCQQLLQYLSNVKNEFQGHAYEIQFASIRDQYKAALKSNFAYEFSHGDLERIQDLINELRSQIVNVSALENTHKQRLLSRLEKLQSELHKRVSDLDRFWGMIGDAGVVLGKLGNDAKPIVDRIREIADIVWRTQSRAEELPSGTKPPLLENNDQ